LHLTQYTSSPPPVPFPFPLTLGHDTHSGSSPSSYSFHHLVLNFLRIFFGVDCRLLTYGYADCVIYGCLFGLGLLFSRELTCTKRRYKPVCPLRGSRFPLGMLNGALDTAVKMRLFFFLRRPQVELSGRHAAVVFTEMSEKAVMYWNERNSCLPAILSEMHPTEMGAMDLSSSPARMGAWERPT